jgi:histidinol phosphatase-like enzyme
MNKIILNDRDTTIVIKHSHNVSQKYTKDNFFLKQEVAEKALDKEEKNTYQRDKTSIYSHHTIE